VTPGSTGPSRTAGLAARGILVIGVAFIVGGLSILLLFGLSSPGLPATIWGLLLVVVYGFFEPDTMRAFLGQGQLRAGTKALAQVLLVVAAVVLLNVFARDKLADKQLDLTRNRVNSLAPQTIQIAQGLSKPVVATVWSSQTTTENQTAFQLLQRYHQLNGKLTVQSYTVLDHPQLAQQQKIQQAGSVVFQQQGHPDVITTDLTEQGFDSVLVQLVTGRSPKVYFLTGHGEPDTTTASQTGNSVTVLVAALQKQGITVGTLNLAAGGGGGTVTPGIPGLATPAPAAGATASPAGNGAPTPSPTDTGSPSPGAPAASPSPPAVAAASVPADADEVVILDPQASLSAAELAALNAYVDRGGHLLVSAGPFSKGNVNDVVKRFGLSFGGGIVIDNNLQLRGVQGGILEIQSYGQHIVSRGMNTLPTILLGATPVKGSAPSGYTLTPVIASQSDACQRTDASDPTPTCAPGDGKGPFNLVVTVEQTGARSGAVPVRAVLIGSSSLDGDAIALSQSKPPGNQPLMINAINWLAGQDKVINVPPHTDTPQAIFFTEGQKAIVGLGYPFLLPLLILGLGVNAYLRRR
jgi:hypothetical protein